MNHASRYLCRFEIFTPREAGSNRTALTRVRSGPRKKTHTAYKHTSLLHFIESYTRADIFLIRIFVLYLCASDLRRAFRTLILLLVLYQLTVYKSI